ncbi:STAS domain-containing protein [Leptolyngbya sp. FACHB-711]|jgi:anti-anti-sigma factor|uniref:STAS domain-containing protein n=1 Tax=unclassified Leptolyngbya TaxID=2650499 RepID=UPI001686264F|nr:STAS domain-containing protein [Leptolyngbya sp. FACHB-711]MBD1849253.1 STAS domain-containing protein [Cyanobacteria bacterium FACHB-502]MBD2027663.1 STAS domain-containing protein [Leptolyngbya sp. FACHB-711]
MPGFDKVSPLRIDREIGQHCQIFRLSGIFDVFSVPTFCRVLEKSVEENPRNSILDFTDVDLIDSSSFGVLVDLCKKIQKNGGTLQIVGSPRVARVIQCLRLEQFLSLQPSVDAALRNLEKS